jgi:2'-5' RNA ligase
VTEGALLVPFPEVAEAVEPWMERTSASSKPSQGIPAHVTLLFPLPADVDGIRAVLENVLAFEVVFSALCRFPGTLWLAPEPREAFVGLTERLVARFQTWLPYGGGYDAITPHLTVAQGDVATLDAAERDIAPRLPLRGRAREALLLTDDESGTWVRQAAFSFEEA